MSGRLRSPTREAQRAGRTGIEAPTPERGGALPADHRFVWGWAADARQAMLESRVRAAPMSPALGYCKPATPNAAAPPSRSPRRAR